MPGIRWLDSYSFFQCALSSLPKAFDLKKDLKKGFFPHYFNNENNFAYVGEYPEPEYFGVKFMKPQTLKVFQAWYHEEIMKNNVFDFKKQIIDYCRSDVEILLESVLKFKKLFQTITKIDPYTRSFTLASIGMECFRSFYLMPETIAITPIHCYGKQRKCSMIANAWLDYNSKKDSTFIEREWKLGNFYADGFSQNLNKVYEFWGCWTHGCSKCYQESEETKEKQSLVKKKIDFYIQKGYSFEQTWECQLRNELRVGLNTQKSSYIKSRLTYYAKIKKVGHASIRKAFFGGRTGNLKFYCETNENEQIFYYDVCSLYPDRVSKCEYPIKHPVVYKEDFDYSLKSYFGFVLCKVLPPHDLYLPILPMKIRDTLIFPLCYTCALNEQQELCQHTKDERCLTNTWTTLELLKAIENGYVIKEIYEVLHWSKKTNQLFALYIKKWLKIKQEKSGWPKWVKNEEDKLNYIKKYEIKEGIKLDYDQIEENPAMRMIAKLMLNSFW